MSRKITAASRTARAWRTARYRAQLSQAELARRAGLAERTIRNVESGSTTPRELTAYAVAHVLDVEPAELLPEGAVIA